MNANLYLQARWQRIKNRLEARKLAIADGFDSNWLPRVAEFGTWCFEHPRATFGLMLGGAVLGALLGYAAGSAH